MPLSWVGLVGPFYREHIFANRGSRKGREIAVNPRAALTAHWPAIERQVRVEGTLEPVTDAEADAYFALRLRLAQAGAWASRQSAPLATRDELRARVAEVEARFQGQPIPRPPFWGGWRLVPHALELWRAGEGRLHERTLYERQPAGAWTKRLLFP